MIKPLRALLFATAAVTLAGAAAPAQQFAPPPAVAGFRLGAEWRDIARAMPCRGLSIEEQKSHSRLWPDFVAHIRICEASDSVSLRFVRDSLFTVVVRLSDQNVGPSARWRQLSEWATATLGMPPDSVALHESPRQPDSVLGVRPGLSSVDAYWGPRSPRLWSARLALYGFSPFDYPVLGHKPGWSSGDLVLFGCVVVGMTCNPWPKSAFSHD